jgi:hypothetical protein
MTRRQLDEKTAMWLDRMYLALPWVQSARISDLEADIGRLAIELNRLGNAMTQAESEQYERLANLAGVIKAEFASLKAQLDEALQSQDEAVAQALGDDASTDAERLRVLIDALTDAVPGQTPEVPVPDPGEPATEPGPLPDVPESPAGEAGATEPDSSGEPS